MIRLAGGLARLGRARVCLLAAAGSAAGYLAVRPLADAGLLATASGMFLLAAGGPALNQAQERREDALMRRTAGRPPCRGPAHGPGAGAGVRDALSLGLALLAAGQGGSLCLGLALGGLALYNGLYTPLKRRTPQAILGGWAWPPGALPPLLGWTAAGGSPLDARALLLAAIFYLWQVPHFGLLARMRIGRTSPPRAFPWGDWRAKEARRVFP